MSTQQSQQWQQALQVANRRRLAISRLKAEIGALEMHEGCGLVADLLESGDELADVIPVGRLLRSIRGFDDRRIADGAGKVAGLLRLAGVWSSDRRVGALTERQRGVLAEALRCGGWRRAA